MCHYIRPRSCTSPLECPPAGRRSRPAAPAATLTVIGAPIGVVPLRIVKVSVPSLTVPAGLVTVALSGTFCATPMNGAEALAAAVAVAAAPTIRLWLLSEDPAKFGRAVVDGLDDVGAGRRARRQGVGRARRHRRRR